MRKKSDNRPNILLINIDDMGWKDVGFMGSQFYETPYMDALATGGTIFTNGYASAANCAPSRACMMTGLWTPRHGIYTVNSSERGASIHRKIIPTPNTTILDRQFKTFPAVLQEKGYTTCTAGKWHISEDPIPYGFDINIGGSQAGHPGSYYPPYKNVDLQSDQNQYLTDRIMDGVLDFMDSVKNPFFLYYTPYAVHTPIHPVDSLLNKYENKPNWQGQSNAAYATMVENLDRNIGRLMRKLNVHDRIENTLIILTSDNGGLYGITYQKPLRDGKGSYYEGGIRVPFVFNWQGQINSNQENDTPISNLDIFPTVLQILDIDLDDYQLDGQNLEPLLFDESEPFTANPVYWHFPVYLQSYDVNNNQSRDSLFRTRPGSAIRYGEWKLHHYFEDDGLELYNLREDIGEMNNLASTLPDKTDELYRMLDNWRREVGAPIPKALNPEYKQSVKN